MVVYPLGNNKNLFLRDPMHTDTRPEWDLGKGSFMAREKEFGSRGLVSQ